MDLNARSALKKSLVGTHSFLSPSSPAWVNYEDDKLDRVFYAAQEARRGARMHAVAHELIEMRIPLPDIQRTLNLYVNDAIGYKMFSEVLLYYSDNCYGHADTVGFRDNVLRIHDLKNGVHPTSMKQLEIYAALFCLDWKFRPFDIQMELRIYQNNTAKVHIPDPTEILQIMEKIRSFDKRIEMLKMED